MKNMIRRALLLGGLLALALTVPALGAPEPNIVTYLPQGETEPHTIHWAAGIQAPTMPGQTVDGRVLTPEEAEMKLINGSGYITDPRDSTDPGYEEYYVSAYTPGRGWYDLNKQFQSGNPRDDDMCFALSALNTVHWWLDQNRPLLERYVAGHPENDGSLISLSGADRLLLPDSASLTQDSGTSLLYPIVLEQYGYQGRGGFPDLVVDLLFNGYLTDQESQDRNRPESFSPAASGGLLAPALGKSVVTDRSMSVTYDQLNTRLADDLDHGRMATIAYNFLGPDKGHAVTLWGAEYDENGRLCAVYLADNNDGGKLDSHYFGPNGSLETSTRSLIGMIRYTVYKGEYGKAQISTYKDPAGRGSKIIQYFPLTLGQEALEHYLTEGEPLYRDGRALLNPMDPEPNTGEPGCSHDYVYETRGSRITERCTRCGYYQYAELGLRMDYDYMYDGREKRPYFLSRSAGWNHNTSIHYENNVNAGQAVGFIRYGGVSVRWPFTITPRPMEVPAAGPEELSHDAGSVTLRAVPGLEYSLDLEHWQAEGTFTGLMPDTAYTFRVRTAAPDSNHCPSEPAAAVLTVRTDDGPIPEAPSWRVVSVTGGPEAQVTVERTGAADTVTVVLAGYDGAGRQVLVSTAEVTCAGEQKTVTFPVGEAAGQAVRWRAFLTGEGFRPVA